MARAPPLLLLLLLLRLWGLVAAGRVGGPAVGHADLQDKCESSDDCVVDNSVCIDNICNCEDDFVSIGTSKCLPKVGYEEECQRDEQCMHLTPTQSLINCVPGVCRCPGQMIYRDMACWNGVYLEEGCRSDLQCIPEHSSCQNAKCQCNSGYEQLDKETCTVELPKCELIPGAHEVGGKCECVDPDQIIITNNNDKECVTVAFGGINDPCEDDLQCQIRMGDGAVCLKDPNNRVCRCDAGYHYLHGLCWRSAGHGEACESDAECVALGEWDAYACVDSKCACAPDAQAKRPGVQPLCRRTARENEECESVLDCIEGLDCANPTSDPRGTHCYEAASFSIFNASIDRTRGVAGGREECGDHEEPSPSGNRCVCQHGYFRSSSSGPCVPELGEPCSVGDVNDDLPYSLCRRSAKFPYVPPASDEEAATTDDVGVWSCQGGFAPAPDNRECLKTRKFNFNCEADSQCGYYGGVCINPKCICASKYIYLEDKLLCWPESGLNEACISDKVCLGGRDDNVRCDFSESTEEDPEGVCVCKSGYHEADGTCRVDALALGEPCIGDIDCVFAEGDVSVACTNGRCACREGYIQYNKTICLYDVSAKCELIEGTIEENGECVCENRDYVIDGSRSKCIKSAFEGVGAACDESAQCVHRMGQGAGCVNGACACLGGYHYLHGQCWLTKGFGDACNHDAECYQFAESDAYACVDNVCACAADAAPRRPGANPICRRNARDGEECESTLDCINNLICDKPTANALSPVCLEVSRLSSPVRNSTTHSSRVSRVRRSSAQRHQVTAVVEGEARLKCGPNEQLTPSHTACMCQRGYWRANSTSGCVPELGEPCYVGDDPDIPHIEYASCRRSAKYPYTSPPEDEVSDEPREPDGVWACIGGFVAAPDNRECEKTRQNAFNCQIDAQCGYYGGICNGRSCTCEAKHHYVTEKYLCWPTKGLNEECDSDADCGVDTANSVYCSSEDTSDTEDPTEPERLTRTTEGVCRCKSGYHAVKADCRKEAYKIGESCVGNEDCVFALDDPLIICDYRQCDCADGYFPFNETSCQIGVGGKCSATAECRNVADTICLDGECQCRDGYVTGSDEKCLPIATEYGDECEDDDQCTPLAPDFMTCAEGEESSTCSCWPNMHYHNSACWSTKSLNQKCGHMSECFVENSVCRNNYCMCDYGYVEDGSNGCISGSPISMVAGSAFSLTLVALASRFL